MKKLLLIALSTLAVGAQAADMNKFHVGGGLSAWTMKADSNYTSGQFNLTALEGVASYDLLPWLSVDGRLGVGVEGETETFKETSKLKKIADVVTTPAVAAVAAVAANPTATPPVAAVAAVAAVAEVKSPAIQRSIYAQPIKAELNYYASLFIKPQVKNDKAAFYGLIGITMMDVDYSAGDQMRQDNTYLGTIADPDNAKLWSEEYDVPDQELKKAEEVPVSDPYLTVGVGVSLFFDRWTVNAEWKSLANSDELGATGMSFKTSNLTANVTYSF